MVKCGNEISALLATRPQGAAGFNFYLNAVKIQKFTKIQFLNAEKIQKFTKIRFLISLTMISNRCMGKRMHGYTWLFSNMLQIEDKVNGLFPLCSKLKTIFVTIKVLFCGFHSQSTQVNNKHMRTAKKTRH